MVWVPVGAGGLVERKIKDYGILGFNSYQWCPKADMFTLGAQRSFTDTAQRQDFNRFSGFGSSRCRRLS